MVHVISLYFVILISKLCLTILKHKLVFLGEGTDLSTVKDIVTQSAEATKLFEALLIFYMNNPEELEFSTLKNSIQRYDSKDSIQSTDSNDSRGQRKVRIFHMHN
ncbi:unnamed protein product [Acanthoscelides obtectus]|uniref:Uncharacterized protein n=1 Tax=Acanthoscelides obtectus TaxID=200917 RepID=A0A9P0PDQ8_ACAOB|nr:unnamed protein product [Acanthoscelides obtectus]CAK1647715.1 hypothetical protein AOBTE_LOCUS15363 [Acanthoscelides obtectus]